MKADSKLQLLRGDRSRREIAESIGVSESAYIKYERGERVPRDSIKRKIADFFGVSVEYIFFA